MANPSIWDLLSDIEAGVPESLGQALMAASTPVVIASDQSPIPISGTVSIGSGPFAVTQSGTWVLGANSGVDIGDVTINNAAGASAVNIQDGGNSITVDGTIAATQSGTWDITNISGTISLPTGASTAANQTTGNTSLSNIDGKLPATLGQKLMAASLAVVLASDQSTIPVSIASLPLPSGAATESTLSSLNSKFASATATLSNVAASLTSVTLLASNSSRKGAVLYNDCALPCYVKFGSTASTTSFTVYLTANSHLILDDNPVYTGIITGIWTTGVGNMRVTELT